MQLLDRPPVNPAVTDTVADSLSGQNQKIYARLKMSLRLNLRRQIFIAVCDDLELRNQLVAQLQKELIRPQFVSLNLNLGDPNPMAQVVQWLGQHPTPLKTGQTRPGMGFQILGVEQLTRQPAAVQKRFLTHLQAIEYYLPVLDCALLLWLPRPWLRMVRQAAPTFWGWHTAVFEFEGDPTPLREWNSSATRSTTPIVDPWIAPAIATRHATTDRALVPQPFVQSHYQPLPVKGHLDDRGDRAAIFPDDLFGLETVATQQESLWGILSDDLERMGREDSLRKESVTQEHEVAAIAPPLASTLHTAQSATVLSPVTAPPTVAPPPTASPASSSADAAVHDLSASALALKLADLVLTAIAAEPTAEHHQSALDALQQIEQLQQQTAPQQALAAVYYTLGRVYREQIEQGNSAELTLAIAIQAHECALECLEEHSSLWADALNDLGNLYWMHSRYVLESEGQLASLKHAIQAYQKALTVIDPQAQSQTFAMIQNNLGSAYGDLAQYQEPAQNLQKSVQAYEMALRSRTAADDPARHAATQNNLGTTCWNLAQHQQPTQWLMRAIAAYREALRHYTPDCEPISYAMIQNNVGTAYWNLAQHLQSGSKAVSAEKGTPTPDALLRFAIASYDNALAFRTLEAAPMGYAATQNNLGTAHWNLATYPGVTPQECRDRLLAAISAYEAAIAAVETLADQTGHRPALTFDVFATRNNLGLAYYQLATQPHSPLTPAQRQQHLELALTHHLSALQNWEPSSEFHQAAMEYVLQTMRAFYTELGIPGQNLALSRVPPQLLPEIMQKL